MTQVLVEGNGRGVVMFKTSFSATVCLVLLLVLCHATPVLAQAPFQQRVTGTCPGSSAIRQINADGSVVCETNVTSVATGSGLTGGPITSSGTINIVTGGVTSAHIADGTVAAVDVNSTQIQLRVTGSCPTGSAIQAVNENGTVTCQSAGSGTVRGVTASAPLVSSGGTTPNISLPDVIITGGPADNTAIGSSALASNTTGGQNTASGAEALVSNTTGGDNTASGFGALFSNTTGFNNTASGAFALFTNTTGNANTASGVGALERNFTGGINTASGFNALFGNTTGSNNTASGANTLVSNSTGSSNAANGSFALGGNTTGSSNTASGASALQSNTTGSSNTAIGNTADVLTGDLTNATAIGAGAIVDASNKIRLGNILVTVIEGQVPFTSSSDQTKKENFQPVDGDEVLRKLRGLSLTSWNYIGHDPKQFRHYGPMGQEFFAAFGHDGIGTIGSPTTLASSDVAGILMSAVQALEKRTVELQAENGELKARLERLERTLTGYAMK